MKIYVKSNSNDSLPIDLSLSFEIVFCIDEESIIHEPIASSISMKNGRYYITVPTNDGRIEQEITEEFYTYVESILNQIEQCGFVELDTDKSNRSDSLYFVFCYESEFVETNVEALFSLRVSNHDLPRWRHDESTKDAKKRQEASGKSRYTEYNWTNTKYTDSTEPMIQVIPSYIKYEGHYYDRLDIILDDVKRRLTFLKQKVKPKS